MKFYARIIITSKKWIYVEIVVQRKYLHDAQNLICKCRLQDGDHTVLVYNIPCASNAPIPRKLNIDGLVQTAVIPSAIAIELLQFCTKPPIYPVWYNVNVDRNRNRLISQYLEFVGVILLLFLFCFFNAGFRSACTRSKFNVCQHIVNSK